MLSRLCLWLTVVVSAAAGRRVFSQTEIGFCVSDGREAPRGPQNHPAEKVQDSRNPLSTSVGVVFAHPPRLSSVSTSQEIPGSNTSGAVLPHLPSSSSGQPQADAPSSFTPTLAAHFDETLVRHIQGWPSETTEKQVRCCRGPLLLGLLPLVFLPSAVPLYPTGEASSLKWSQPSYWPFLSPLQQLKLVLLS